MKTTGSNMRQLRRLWKWIRKHPWWLALLFLLLVLKSATEILMPIVVGMFVDHLSSGEKNLETSLWHLGIIAAAGLSFWILHLTMVLIYDKRKVALMREITSATFQKVQLFERDWHESSFSGGTVRKIGRGWWEINRLMDQFIFGFIPIGLLFLGMASFMLLHWPLLAIIVVIGAALYGLASVILLQKWCVPYHKKSAAADSHVGATMADSITGHATVQQFGQEKLEQTRFEESMMAWEKASYKAWSRWNIAAFIQSLFMTLVKMSLFGAALYFWWMGQMSIGEVVFVIGTYQLLSGYIRGIGERISATQQALAEMEDMMDFLERKPAIREVPNAKPLQVERGEITFEELSFRYPETKTKLFGDFSLQIPAGQKVALVGRSGGGKTSIFKLLQRMYDPQEGRILLDGQDIHEATLESLRKSMALVPQDPILFHRSLSENIAYAKPEASQKEIEEAARRAEAHDFITKLSDGYETLVGERGVKLSGGERQRVAIARAILADTPILLLDEATSALDSESEQAIQQALETLMENKTVLIIAHRLSTITSADRILVLDEGQIVEDGNHETLLNEEGIYASLWKRQVGGFLQ